MAPATLATKRYFKKEGEDVWHIYREDSNVSLCGEAQLTYNVDQISDAVPDSGTLHLACREAEAAEDGPSYVPHEAPSEPISEEQVVEGSDVGDLGAVLGEGSIEAGAVIADPATAEPETDPTSSPDDTTSAVLDTTDGSGAQPSGEVIDGDDGTAPAVEEDPAP